MWVCLCGLDSSSISLNNVPFLVAHGRDFQLGKHRPQRGHSCELKPALAFPQRCQLSHCQNAVIHGNPFNPHLWEVRDFF